jgi:hypothetical protein
MKLHVVDSHHNDLYAFYGRTDVPRCKSCRNLIDKWNVDFIQVEVPTSMRMDISTTYDGVTIASTRFVQVVADNKLRGLGFHDLGDGSRVLLATRRIAFDSVSRRTKFENQCSRCGQYEAVAGATPAFLCPPVDVAPDEFVWTDVEFGTGDEKQPLLICGDVARAALRRAKLKGLDTFKEVRGL